MFALFRILVFIKSSPDYQGISVEIEACPFGFPVKIGAVMSQDCSQLKMFFGHLNLCENFSFLDTPQYSDKCNEWAFYAVNLKCLDLSIV